MIKLRWLKLNAFRSFPEETTINFPDSGLVLIRGFNPETGDPSGSGKSSILLAIAYVLDILPSGFPATELQSWYTDSPMQVQLGLEIEGKEVVFGKGKKTFIKHHDKTVTGAKAVAEEQFKLLGLNPDVFGALTYRAQNTSGLFLSKTDSEKKEFLTRILGLDSIEAAIDQAEAKIKDINPKLEMLRGQLQQNKDNLAKIQQNKPVSVNVDITNLQKAVESKEKELKVVETAYQEAKWGYDALANMAKEAREAEINALKAKSDQAKDFLTKVREADSVKYAEFRKRQEHFQNQIRHLDATLQNIVFLKNERDQKLKELNSVRAGKCPTCLRMWDESIKKEEELSTRIAAIEADTNGEEALVFSRSKVQQELKEMSFTADPNIEALVGIGQKLGAEIKALQSKMLDLPQEDKQLTEKLYNAKLSLKEAQNAFALATAKKESQEKELKQYELWLSDAEKRVLDTQTAFDLNNSEASAEKDFIALIGREGFLGVIFEEVLREIAEEANVRLARLANVSHVTISFKTEVTTQTKGSVRRNITTVVNVGGREAKKESALSGGMQTSVEQVVDLAVMSVVQRRTGKIPGWLCLDEVFNGQGNVTKEMAMEVLKEFANDKLVLVIDHGSEFQQLFNQIILVTQKGGTSSVEYDTSQIGA